MSFTDGWMLSRFVRSPRPWHRPPSILADDCQHKDMVQFAGALWWNTIISMGRYGEVAWWARPEDCDMPAARVAARREVARGVLPSMFYSMAVVQSGWAFYFENDWTREYQGCQDANGNYSHWSICCCLAGWASSVLVGYYMDVLVYGHFWGNPTDGPNTTTKHHRMVERSVPLNIHFCIHRKREWFMVMFGESIISLLIVDGHNEDPEYTLAFYSGIISVLVLAHWHYRSAPENPDEHAISRSRHSRYLYGVLLPIYSAALISVGVSYKLFIYEYQYEYQYQSGEGGDAHRSLSSSTGNYYHQEYSEEQYEETENDTTTDVNSQGHYAYQKNEEDVMRQQFAANLFSISMAVVLMCMDLRVVLHKGIPKILDQAKHSKLSSLVGYCVSRYTIVAVLGTFGLHHSDPHVMAVCCLAAIVSLEFLSTIFSLERNARRAPDHDITVTDSIEVALSSDNDTDNGYEQYEHIVMNGLAVFERQTLMDEGSLGKVNLDGIDGCHRKTANVGKTDTQAAVYQLYQ